MYLNKVLVTSDFSESSFLAFEAAKHHAKLGNCEITLMNIYELSPLCFSYSVYTPPDEVVQKVEAAAKAESERQLNHLQAKFFSDLKIETVSISSIQSPADAISGFAARNNFGLVVVATQGKGALRRLLLGSTAEQICRYSTCPVLIVPPRKDNSPKFPYERVLVTTDFSSDSENAFKYAAYEAKVNHSKVTVANVLEELIAPSLLGLSSRDQMIDLEMVDYEKIQRDYQVAAQNKLSHYVKENFILANVETKLIEKSYSVAHSICEFAQTHQFDLIVVSTHGAGGRLRLVGGVAEAIIRNSPCPVLVVPKPGRSASPQD